MDAILFYSYLLVLSSGIFSYKIYLRSKYVLDLGILFNVFIIIYSVIGINIYWTVFNSNKDVLEEIIKVIFFSSIAFNLVYSRTESLNSLNRTIRTPSPFIINFLFFLIAVSYLCLMIMKGVLFVDRTLAFSVLYQNKYFFLLSSFQLVLYIIIAFNYYTKRSLWFFYIATSYLLFLAILTISRHDFFAIFIVNVFFMIRTNRLSSFKLILYSIILFAFFLFFKQILYVQILGVHYNSEPDYGEVINWIRNTINTLNSNISYEFNPYLVTLEGVFNPFIDSEKPLTNWYIKTFFYDRFLAGNKFGYSFIGESYMAGSPYLLIFVFSFYGYLFKKISFKTISPTTSVIQIVVFLMMYKLFRSESYNFFRSIVWSYFIPLIIIQLFSIINLGISKKTI